MSELSGQQAIMEQPLADPAQIKEQDIVDYLQANPDFFTRHASLLEDLQIPHPQKHSVSLVELQSDQLRSKIKLLNNKLAQLISVAKQNEAIYRVYADLNLRLVNAKTVSELEQILEDVMLNQLKLSAVALRPFSGPYALPEIQQKLFKEKRFKQSRFFFGRISQHEKSLLLDQATAESVALVLLGEHQDQGILAVGSKDPGHFNPQMDTLLLNQLQQFLSVFMPKLPNY